MARLFDRPQLLVVVDAEEEFAWDRPFDRRSNAKTTIPAQDRAHAIYDRYGVVPTYVMDYPVATAPSSAAFLRRLVDAGSAAFGTHCHPWVTPPHEEDVNERNSYHGNLPPELEAAKFAESTRAVAEAMGGALRIFKAATDSVRTASRHCSTSATRWTAASCLIPVSPQPMARISARCQPNPSSRIHPAGFSKSR